ncbi:hypothetical protein [Nocardia sp. MDA0666]|nr:hypothetical protein [Nocardia sp. MDA0666]
MTDPVFADSTYVEPITALSCAVLGERLLETHAATPVAGTCRPEGPW